ncbi:MAG TPA: hypothetical protein P5140_05550 [Methanofastidiosum sp.]|mgnify:CR=1 FL=1|nr:hypothetical protein [Methanofastidiosum sp.]
MRRSKDVCEIITRGDLIFWYPHNWITKIIAYFSGRYSHVGIYIGNSQVLSCRPGGIVIEELSLRNKYDVYKLNVSKDRKEEMIKFFLSQMSAVRYDYFGILKYLFRKMSNPRKFWCSEFISWGCYYIGLVPDSLELSPIELANQSFVSYITTIQRRSGR